MISSEKCFFSFPKRVQNGKLLFKKGQKMTHDTMTDPALPHATFSDAIATLKCHIFFWTILMKKENVNTQKVKNKTFQNKVCYTSKVSRREVQPIKYFLQDWLHRWSHSEIFFWSYFFPSWQQLFGTFPNSVADRIKLFFLVFRFSLFSLSVLLHIEKNHW